jgi:ABC-type multidrug transport system fused ATPase/permease subunit
MSTVRQFLVFLTGHRLSPDTPIKEIGSLTKIGSAIAFASFLAAIQFGIAGWFLSAGQPLVLRLLMTVVCSAVGLLIVLVLDRNFIYLADTRYETEKNISYFYLGIRVFLITVIGSLSSQFTMPLLLKSELEIHAQDLKDGRYSQSKEFYQQKYELADKSKTLETIDQKIVRLKKELQNPPQDITRKRAAADRCFQDYRQKVRSTFAPDLDESEILQLYAKDKQECERLDAGYRSAYQAYVTPREAELSKAGEEITQAQVAVETAKASITNDLNKTSSIHEAYINVGSADVLWSLVTTNGGAFMKYVLLTLLQLCLELMPIFLKIQAGQSQMGHRIALKAYEHKTKTLAQMNLSASQRLQSETQLQFARHEQAMDYKKQEGEEQKYALQLTYQKLEQELINEKLKREIDELRRQTSAYARMQGYFIDPVRSAMDGFATKAIFPTVQMVSPNATDSKKSSVFAFAPHTKEQKVGT